MKLQDIKTTPKTITYSQPVKSKEVHSDEEAHKKHAHSAKASSELVLTAPQPRKHFIARSDKDESGKAKAETTPVTTLIESDLLGLLGHSESEKQVKVLEAQHEIAQAYEAHKAETDSAKKTPLEKILTDLIKKHETTLPGYDPSRADEAKNIKTALDAEKVKLSGHTAHAKAQKIIDGINGGHDGITEARATEIAKANKGLSLWGWAGITALSLIPAGIQWFMGNNASKAAEAKAQAAEDKVTALEQQLQELLRGLVTQVIQPMQVKGDKAIDLLARLLKLEQKKAMGTASAPVRSSVSSAKVASRSAHSDDNSATPPAVDLAKLEKEVAELEKQQASGGGKPAPAQPQGGGTPNTGAMPQPATMPQQSVQGGGTQGSTPFETGEVNMSSENPKFRRKHTRPPEEDSREIILGDSDDHSKVQVRDGQYMP